MILKYCHLLPNMIYSIHYSYISSTTFLIIDAKKWTYSHTSEHWKFHDCSAPLRCAIAWVWSLGPHLPGRPGPKALLLPGMASAKLGKAMEVEVWDCLRTSAAFGSDFTNNIKEFKNIPQYSRIFQNVSECFRMFQNVSECFRMFQNVSECFRMFQNVSECFRMFQNVSECPKPSHQPCLRCHGLPVFEFRFVKPLLFPGKQRNGQAIGPQRK